MQRFPPNEQREHLTKNIDSDLVVVGGGMAGTCCAIAAARAGIRVVLIHDRPVLGGNASSEVRMWIVGATSHMGNNNRWAREGGVIDEILVDNIYRNPEGNPLIFDTLLLEKVKRESNITLLLNTVVYEVSKSESEAIDSVRAFCSQNRTLYEAHAPLFCDASGDGVIGYLSGAAFRMGAESHDEFGEKLAPSKEYGELLGHTIFFYSKDTGKPVRFIPPSYALQDITIIPRYQNFNTREYGSRLWWIEYGGRLDTVYDTEEIKWELWKIVYGVWNYIKNSGRFPEAETLTLEWVGQITGKRESRRFEGDYILHQQDLIKQRHHADAVSFGGWALDLHPADGIYSEKPGCNQWHSRGIYQIPYRCLYSCNINNLFLAGRIISTSHVAFSSTRVQATLAQAAQAVGMGAAQCIQKSCLPRDVTRPPLIQELQQGLIQSGQYIPGVPYLSEDDLARRARVSASSHLLLKQLPPNGPWLTLENSWAQMLPMLDGRMPSLTFVCNVEEPTSLRVELRTGHQPDCFTPSEILDAQTIPLLAGKNQSIRLDFDVRIEQPRYLFVCLIKNLLVSVRCSEQRLTGILSVSNKHYPEVSNFGRQEPSEDIGVETFEFWCPQRRPGGHNLAITIDPFLDIFKPANVTNGWNRPTCGPNAWVADIEDPFPSLTLDWDTPQAIQRIILFFDTDFDHPMETVLMGHPERVMPFCIKCYKILDDKGQVIYEKSDNYQTINNVLLDVPISTQRLVIQFLETHGMVPAALFGVSCYENVR